MTSAPVAFVVEVDTLRGAPRPRVRAKGGAYYPQWYGPYRDAVRAAYRGPCFVGPVRVDIDAAPCLPKSKRRRGAVGPAVDRPDVDNVAKAILDALNGVAYVDDSQVVELHARRRPKDCRERTEIAITVTPL